MRLKLNLKDKDQMSKPNEYTDNFKSNLTCIFPSVRAKLKKPLCPRTLCTYISIFVCKDNPPIKGIEFSLELSCPSLFCPKIS